MKDRINLALVTNDRDKKREIQLNLEISSNYGQKLLEQQIKSATDAIRNASKKGEPKISKSSR